MDLLVPYIRQETVVVLPEESHFVHDYYQLIGMKAATPAGTAQAENPLLWLPCCHNNELELCHWMRVRRNGNQRHRRKSENKNDLRSCSR